MDAIIESERYDLWNFDVNIPDNILVASPPPPATAKGCGGYNLLKCEFEAGD